MNVVPNSTSATVKSGGFAGQLYGGAVTNVYALGTVQGRDCVGGLFGESEHNVLKNVVRPGQQLAN